MSPFDVVCAHEVAYFSVVLWFTKHEYGGDLCHGFYLKDSRHDGVVWEVSWEEWFINGDIFNASAFAVTFEVDDTVYE